MPEDTATLRDTVVNEPQAEPVAAVTTTTEPEVKAPNVVELPSAEAAELGQMLLASGITKDQVNSFLEAPKALEALRYQWENNPRGFVEMLERTAPAAGGKFLEEVSAMYLDRNKYLVKPAGEKPAEVPNELMQEMQKLKDQTSQLLNKEQQREQAAFMAGNLQRFNARVDDMLGLKEVQDMKMSPSEVKNLRARLSQEIVDDKPALQRVNSGNFVDVPRVFQSLLNEKTAEKKAAIEAEKGERERVKSNSFSDFSSGPDTSFLGDISKIIADDNDPGWEGTIQAFGKALDRASR